jgi:hypothetical protein
MTNDIKKAVADEVARQLAELKAKEAPMPFVEKPYQRYDPTAGMCMPRSTLEEMARTVPTGMLRDIVHDNRAPTGRPGMIPQQSDARAPVPSPTPGWVDPTPLRPPPGIELIDRAVNAALPHGPEWGKEKK